MRERGDGQESGAEVSAGLYPQPVAMPPILALYGFFGATMLIGPWLVGLYGNRRTPLYIAPLAFTLGGVAQFSAALWSFRSRQWVISDVSSAWATLHGAWGLLFLLVAAAALTEPQDGFAALGIWYIVLGALTWVGVAVTWRLSWAITVTFALAAASAIALGIAEFLGLDWLRVSGGWVVTLSAVGAWYTASALLLQAVYGRWLLPVGTRPWVKRAPKVAPGRGEPGVESPGRGQMGAAG